MLPTEKKEYLKHKYIVITTKVNIDVIKDES